MNDRHQYPDPPAIPHTLVDVSRLKTESDFRSITTAFAREMGQWLKESTFLMPHPEGGWSDEGKAVLCAQVVRLSKMLTRMAHAIEAEDEETALIFSRCAFETIVNFHYLRTPSGDRAEAEKRLRLFKVAGFRPESKIRRDLRARITQTDPTIDDLERDALEGIDAYWEAEAMPDKVQELPDIASRLRKADMDPRAEIYYFAIPSQAIHGSYQNLLKFHLQLGELAETMVPRYEADEINTTVFQAVVEHALGVLDLWLIAIHPLVQQSWRNDLVEFQGRLTTLRNALVIHQGDKGREEFSGEDSILTKHGGSHGSP